MLIETDTALRSFLLENLHIEDGQLLHRDWFLDTNLGPVIHVTPGPGGSVPGADATVADRGSGRGE